MAHKETIQHHYLKQVFTGSNHIFTVSTNVGYGCKNMREDVRLVQFFINSAIDDLGEDWKRAPKRLEEDGLFGGKTWGAVKSFQKYTEGAVVDGMITPANGKRMYTPSHKYVYTIYYLNWYYFIQRPQFFDDLRRDPKLPGELREYFGRPLPNLM
ncbi:MAG: hypothetical protein DWQ47_04930 [Acidobacteria bacterium]|nr:MAG: hypothetical protein DWQ32_08480 [Acidobacteriota bacterium]REK01726.1 MAG: hypothetical protein DWQ38_04915 [Acidobacteriota bacterium]REK14682.1 MAG: hypothetical protein DWQ43_14170 [Acidobacteriota bacterium]REK45397.1 MAG: hypothetical protein DWQ47_04930 [Acidobacteriota bacterium]